MSLIDTVIPAMIGLLLIAWPRFVFVGSRATPDPKKIRLIRALGAVLVLVAVIYQGIRLAGA